jgi:hypothetical protein
MGPPSRAAHAATVASVPQGCPRGAGRLPPCAQGRAARVEARPSPGSRRVGPPRKRRVRSRSTRPLCAALATGFGARPGFLRGAGCTRVRDERAAEAARMADATAALQPMRCGRFRRGCDWLLPRCGAAHEQGGGDARNRRAGTGSGESVGAHLEADGRHRARGQGFALEQRTSESTKRTGLSHSQSASPHWLDKRVHTSAPCRGGHRRAQDLGPGSANGVRSSRRQPEPQSPTSFDPRVHTSHRTHYAGPTARVGAPTSDACGPAWLGRLRSDRWRGSGR